MAFKQLEIIRPLVPRGDPRFLPHYSHDNVIKDPSSPNSTPPHVRHEGKAPHVRNSAMSHFLRQSHGTKVSQNEMETPAARSPASGAGPSKDLGRNELRARRVSTGGRSGVGCFVHRPIKDPGHRGLPGSQPPEAGRPGSRRPTGSSFLDVPRMSRDVHHVATGGGCWKPVAPVGPWMLLFEPHLRCGTVEQHLSHSFVSSRTSGCWLLMYMSIARLPLAWQKWCKRTLPATIAPPDSCGILV